MKSFLVAAAFLIPAMGPEVVLVDKASAAEVTVKLTDEDQASWGYVPQLMQQCEIKAATEADLKVCNQVAGYLNGFAAKVAAAKAEATKSGVSDSTAGAINIPAKPARADEKK